MLRHAIDKLIPDAGKANPMTVVPVQLAVNFGSSDAAPTLVHPLHVPDADSSDPAPE